MVGESEVTAKVEVKVEAELGNGFEYCVLVC